MFSISNVLLIYSVEAQAFLPSISTLSTMDSNLETAVKPGQSEASIRFRAKMHAHDAHYQKLREPIIARAQAEGIEYRKQRKLMRNQRQLMREQLRANAGNTPEH